MPGRTRNTQQAQPDARTALAQRRENGGADTTRREIGKELQKMMPEFQKAMPRGLEAAQLVRDAMTCLRTVRYLPECLPESIFGALMTCAQLGLRPNVPALGAAYLAPFKDRSRGNARVAQLIVGYQGLIDLAMRSDRLDSVIARTVFDDDIFDVDYGLHEKLEHKPARFRKDGYIEDPDRDPQATDYYSIVRYRGGGYAYWTMSKVQVERHRRRFSKSADSGPWVTDFDAMGMKTCVRLLAKFMPKSTEFAALTKGMAVDEGVRLNYSPSADPIEVTDTNVVEGEIVDTVVEGSGRPAADGTPPPVDEYPPVRPTVTAGSTPPAKVSDRQSREQREALAAAFAAAGIVDPDEQLAYAAEIVGRDLPSLEGLNAEQSATVAAAARRFAEQNEPPAGGDA